MTRCPDEDEGYERGCTYVLSRMCILEMRRCVGDDWKIALSEARESENIMKLLVIGEGGKVSMLLKTVADCL